MWLAGNFKKVNYLVAFKIEPITEGKERHVAFCVKCHVLYTVRNGGRCTFLNSIHAH